MISPGFATLLVFVQTDARSRPRPATCCSASPSSARSSAISVDGQLSTSDTVILQCSGESGVTIEPETDDELHFGEALDAAAAPARADASSRDGEGARRVGRVVVRGGRRADRRARSRARSPNSPLVKTALLRRRSELGPDRRRRSGRRLPGDGAAGGRHRDRGRPGVRARGATCPHDADALKAAVQRDEVEYEIGLPGDGAETEVFFSDLGHEYVTINADYTT